MCFSWRCDDFHQPQVDRIHLPVRQAWTLLITLIPTPDHLVLSSRVRRIVVSPTGKKHCFWHPKILLVNGKNTVNSKGNRYTPAAWNRLEAVLLAPYRNYKLHVHVSNELSRLNLDTGAIFTELTKKKKPPIFWMKKKETSI